MHPKKIFSLLFALFLLGVLVLFFLPRKKEIIKEPITKIGLILNGSRDDKSYCQAQYEAVSSASEKMGLTLLCHDKVPQDDRFPALVEELIEEGCGIITIDSYLYDPYLLDLAEKHPDTYFLAATSTLVADNLSSFIGRIYQVRYLTGIVAGLCTKSNEIGYVVSVPTPETFRQVNAFTIGVKKANAKARVHITYSGDWNDAGKAAEATRRPLDSAPIDVLTLHANTLAPLEVADAAGVYTIGNIYDTRELFPDTYLTACLYNWEDFYLDRFEECMHDAFIGKHYWSGVRSGIVEIAPLTELAKHCSRFVNKELDLLLAIKTDPFYGPIRDTYGTEQVHEDENISDEQLLHGMYWFVEGVVIEP